MVEICSTRHGAAKHFLSVPTEEEKERFVEGVYMTIVSCPMATETLLHSLVARN